MTADMFADLVVKEREKDVEHRCDSLMSQLGWTVVRFSQPRNTMQTRGIPDRKYYHAVRGLTVWFEVKSATGRQRPAQKAFQDMAEACGEVYLIGGVDVLVNYVRSLK